MVTLFLRQGENGKQVLLSFPATTPAEKADVAATMESLKSMSKTVTIQGAASEVMNLGLYLSGVDLAAEGEVERIDQLAERLEHMSEVDCDKFAGMLDANSISGMKDILQLTGRLDDYVILPGCGSAQSIGKYSPSRGRRNTALPPAAARASAEFRLQTACEPYLVFQSHLPSSPAVY